MSTQDIALVSKILLGITNPDKSIRESATAQLKSLSENLGAISYCLLEISSYNPTNADETKVKETSLVILRYILDKADPDEWEKIPNNLQENIKKKCLDLFTNEQNPKQRKKFSEVLIQLSDIISSADQKWNEYNSLVFSMFNYDPSNENNSIIIESLLKLLKESTSFLMTDLMNQFPLLLNYLTTIFKGTNLKLKVLSSELVTELLSYSENDEESDKVKPFIQSILDTLNECITSNNEDETKKLLETIIEASSIEPNLFKNYFQTMAILGYKIITKTDYDDEKIRELSFEMIITMIEEIPSIIKKKSNDLKSLIELIYKYSLEMDPVLGSEWETPNKLNYEDVESYTEEKVTYSQSLIDRLVECLGLKIVTPILFNMISDLITKPIDQSEGSWKSKYIGLYSLASLSEYDEEMSTFETAFKVIFSHTKNPNNKIRFAAVNTINKFCDTFNPDFQKKYIDVLIPLLIEILENESIIRIKCEIVETLTSFIQFTTRENILKYVNKLYEMLFNNYINSKSCIMLRKSCLECVLEITTTIEEDCKPYAEKSFDIVYGALIENFKEKKNKILFGVLIELLTSIGPYIKEKYYKEIPYIFNVLLELVKGIESTKEPIRYDLQSSLEKLLPEIENEFNNLLPTLVECVLTLVKVRPKINIDNKDNNPTFNVEEMLNNSENEDDEEDKKKKMEINSGETEDYCGTLNLLYTIIDSINVKYTPYINDTEKELLDIMKIKFNEKIRNKACKILPLLLKIVSTDSDRQIKGKLYIADTITLIENQDDLSTKKKTFEHLQDIIENAGTILTKEEANNLFAKLLSFFTETEKKRIELVGKKDKNKKIFKVHNKDDDSSDEDISDLIEEDIETTEETVETISEVIGMIFKTHKELSDDMVKIVFSELLPKYTCANSSVFETKMAVYIIDDMIEYLGADKLNIYWDNLSKFLIKCTDNSNDSIRQAASYGIGIFAKFTPDVLFSKYAKDLMLALYNGLKYKLNSKDEDESTNWGLAHDNIIASFGKILFYHEKCNIIKENIEQILTVWVENLPIKYDTVEQEQQHEWLVNLILLNSNIIPDKLLGHCFKTIGKIYKSKNSNDVLNEKIEKIFAGVKTNDKLKTIIEEVYKEGDSKLKKNLESLTK